MLSSPFTALTSVAAASLPPPMQDSPALHTLWQCRHGARTLLPELDRVRVAYNDIVPVSPVAGVWTARLLRCVSWMENSAHRSGARTGASRCGSGPSRGLVAPLHLSRHLPHKVSILSLSSRSHIAFQGPGMGSDVQAYEVRRDHR